MSYGTICSLCLPLLAIWTSPKAKLSTVDSLEADRLEFYYRIAAQVQRNCVSKLWKLSRSWYVCGDCCAKHRRHAQLNCGQVSTDWLLIAYLKHCIVIAIQKSRIHASAVAVFAE